VSDRVAVTGGETHRPTTQSDGDDQIDESRAPVSDSWIAAGKFVVFATAVCLVLYAQDLEV
jgi:hypothetical protein